MSPALANELRESVVCCVWASDRFYSIVWALYNTGIGAYVSVWKKWCVI